MELKTCKFSVNLLSAIATILVIVSFFVANSTVRLVLLSVAVALALAAAVVNYKFWRCPRCGQMLARSRDPRCMSCGWEMMERHGE